MEVIFGLQSAKHRSLPISSQEMINCYAEQPIQNSRATVPIISSYGITTHTNFENIVSTKVINNIFYVLTTTGLYQLTDSGYGQIASFNAAQGSIIEGDHVNILIASNGDLYKYSSGNINKIEDPDIPTVQWIGWLDGYYIIIEKDSGRVFINETPYNADVWSPLDFATAEGNPDNLVWGIVDKRELVLFGNKSIEFWYNSGNSDFPLERSSNGFISEGIMSKNAACLAANTIYFMSCDGVAYMMNGYSPQRISTDPIEKQIEGSSRYCRCFSWKEGGHTMVAFNLSNGCFVYDASTGLWHKRETNLRESWQVIGTEQYFGKWYAYCDSFGYFDGDAFTEYGDEMVSSCTSATINQGKQKIPHDSLWLNFETGNKGIITLQWSDDGGRTWSHERQASFGDTGEYKKEVKFNRLGSSRDRVYRYSVSSPYRRNLLNAYLNEYL